MAKPPTKTCKHERTERRPGATDTGRRSVSYRCSDCGRLLARLFFDGPRLSRRKAEEALVQ